MKSDKNHRPNLQSPIYRIPTEVLSRIFYILWNSHFAELSGPGQRVEEGKEYLQNLINITHVCHVWREVALNTSLLWCYIDVSPPFRSWIPELLRRSKQSPLTVVINRSSHEHGLLEEVKEHFGRTRELVLDDPQDATLEEIFSSPSSTFQDLEALDISDTSLVVDDSLLPFKTLRRLDLLRCSIDWNSNFLQGLTHLGLVNISEDCRPSCHEFTLILSKMPALETLYLLSFLPEDEGVQTGQVVNVHLQHLQELHLECDVPEMAQLLPYFVIPRSCKLHIHASTEENILCNNFRTILSWLSNHLSVPTTSSQPSNAIDHVQYIRSLHLSHDPGIPMFKVDGFCEFLSHEQLKTTEPVLTFLVDWDWFNCEDDSFEHHWRTFLFLLPLRGVTFLDLYLDTDTVHLSPEFWKAASESMPAMKAVYLYGISDTFWKALSPVGRGGVGKKSLSFPALGSVTLRDEELDPQLILGQLRNRSRLGGTRLQDLCFSNAGSLPGLVPTTSIMSKLRKLVSYVHIEDDED